MTPKYPPETKQYDTPLTYSYKNGDKKDGPGAAIKRGSNFKGNYLP